MTNPVSRTIHALIAVGATVGLSGAQAETLNFIDLQGGVGYSTNPRLRINASSSAFGRLSAFANHTARTERGKTSLSGYIENTTYLSHYGSKQVFDLKADTTQAISPTVTVFGNLRFAHDVTGELSNRIYYVPSEPPVSDPTDPLPPTSGDPDLLGLVGSQTRLSGEVGASIRTDPKGTLSLAAGAERLLFYGTTTRPNYTIYFGSLGYDRVVSERTSLGGQLSVQRQEFASDRYANVFNPAVRLKTHLSETITADASVGILVVDQHLAGKTRQSVSPSFSANLCSETTISRFCGHVARDAQSQLNTGFLNSGGSASVATIAGVTYYRRLGADDTIQVSVSGQHRTIPDQLLNEKLSTTYFSAVVGYDRKIGRRLSTGLTAGSRKFFEPGPDPRIDLNGTLYLRYRIGDLK